MQLIARNAADQISSHGEPKKGRLAQQHGEDSRDHWITHVAVRTRHHKVPSRIPSCERSLSNSRKQPDSPSPKRKPERHQRRTSCHSAAPGEEVG